MIQYLPSFPYPPEQNGLWTSDATIDWCEENYYATIYSAEIVNSMTNIFFFVLGIKGILSCFNHGHDTIFLISFVGYLMVAIGSFTFHSTLKYPMQLVDELSMIYTACIMCYACFSFDLSRRFSQLLAISLLFLSVFITVRYHQLQDPSFHQNAFALLAIAVLSRSIYLMEVNLRPSFWARNGNNAATKTLQTNLTSEQVEDTVRNQKILSDMWWMIILGLSIFLGGFGIWLLDNKYCNTFRKWRHEIGLPWGILLEGHGWWHLMTGYGSYTYITWNIWLRHCLNRRQADYELRWPSIFSFPEVISSTKWNMSHQNGSPKARRSV